MPQSCLDGDACGHPQLRVAMPVRCPRPAARCALHIRRCCVQEGLLGTGVSREHTRLRLYKSLEKVPTESYALLRCHSDAFAAHGGRTWLCAVTNPSIACNSAVCSGQTGIAENRIATLPQVRRADGARACSAVFSAHCAIRHCTPCLCLLVPTPTTSACRAAASHVITVLLLWECCSNRRARS